jgi:hypothetical protein
MQSAVRTWAVAVLLTGAVAAQDNSYLKWTAKEARRLLSDSPWAKPMNVTEHVPDPNPRTETVAAVGNPRDTADRPRVEPMPPESGISAEKETHCTYVARLFSALPVRQAHVRLAQIRAGYDRMSDDQKRSFDEKHAALLNVDVKDTIIVAIEFSTTDPNLRVDISQRLRQATRDRLKQSAYLITDHKGRIPLQAYIPPNSDDVGARLSFPRSINGEPVVLPDDDDIKLEFFVPGTSQKVYVTWKVKDLTRNGKPVF